MSISKLTYGGADYDDEIVAGGLDMDHAMVGETLAVDALTVPVMTGDIPVRLLGADQGENDFLFSADGKIICVLEGAPTPEFTKNGVGEFYFGEDLIGAYYLEELRQSGTHEHVMRLLSGIRLLDRSDHPGGLYSGEPAGMVIADIIGGIAPYTIDEDIAQIPIYNYLPYARRRNNLQFVLMAIGAAIKNNTDGSLRFTQLSDTVTGIIDESRVFLGGSVIDRVPATAVQVTEHNYLPSADEIELFNDSSITTETVIFKEPIHDLQITGGEIVTSGVNFCTFTGSGLVVLTGKRYTHAARIITVGTPPTGIDSDVVKRVSNNTLLGPNNAVFVAEKLYAYLSVAQSIKQEVVLGTERPADVVRVLHPHTRQLVDACIKSMQIQFGKTELRAVCEFLVGYAPAGATAGFEHHVVLTGSGTFRTTETLLQYKNTEDSEWTTLIELSEIIGPSGTVRIRLNLCGAGTGGQGGAAGRYSIPGTTGQGGAGGEGGEAGQGGLIFEINLELTPGISYDFSCGTGGVGGTGGVPNYSNPGPGAAGQFGSPTTFGSLSSAMGRLFPYGYTDPKTGLTLAARGKSGAPGGRGNNAFAPTGETVIYDDAVYDPGTNGTAFGPVLLSGKYYTAYHGGGGGAAVGNNGSDGGNGLITFDGFGGVGTYYIHHGSGGQGASAIAGEDAINMGQGGNGGHGGGGGGYRANAHQSFPSALGYEVGGQDGAGGTGGAGGDGGDGCIVIYY